jgi:hypothetical protein
MEYCYAISAVNGAGLEGTVSDQTCGTPENVAASSASLVNGSARGLVLTGDNRLIGGFNIEGDTPMQVLINVRGPGLGVPPWNYPGVLTDPFVKLYSFSAQAYIAQNDDWQVTDPQCDSPAISCGSPQDIINTGSDPCQPNPGQTSPPIGCEKESALLVTLPAGRYTAVVSGANGETGLGIIGFFNQNDVTLSPKLRAVSGRAFVGTGYEKLVGGFIIEGTSPQQVLVRARGSSLGDPPFNNPGVLTNPFVKLYSFSAQAYIAQNDDWQTTDPQCDPPALSCGNAQDILDTGIDPCQPNPGQTAPPTGCEKESALLLTLPPGAYTANISGVNNETGMGLFEAFDQTPASAVRVDQGPTGDQRFPWVDYNETSGEYLVLWQDKRNGSNDDIYGVRLDVDGNRIGSDFPVSTASGHQQRVLVKAGGGGYLAVWHDLRNQAANGADIYGAWIAGDGTVGPEMAICACASDQWNPVAGYDPVTNTFLVVFLDGRGSGSGNDAYDLWGAVIPAGGNGVVTAIPLVVATGGQRGPQLGYDKENQRYYLAWNDRRSGVDYDIYGSRVSPTGTLLDVGGVLLSGAVGNQFRPTVTDRRPVSGVNNHLVAWTDYRNGAQADVYGVSLDGNGSVVGTEFAISTNAANQANVVAEVDWIKTKKSVVGYITEEVSAGNYDIFRATVDPSGGVAGDTLVVGIGSGALDDQRAEVVTYATDGTNDYGFLTVWMDKRNGTDYDIWGIKVWP